MPTADEVIVEFEARVGKYEADVKRSAATFEKATKAQSSQIKALERQITASSSQISGTLKGLAGSFAAAFSAQQIVGLVDSYTRLQNSLRVAGLEGENLATVQTRLLDIGAKYGVDVESLASLYGNAASSAKELGASQGTLLKITEAVSQSLLITGTSTAAASGAILGLQQALASGTVRAEEFNQMNEGGLRPLLAVVAASDKYGGSIAKLRMAVNDGTVSSQEFYAAIANGSAQLEGQAAKATLTLSGAFTSLNNKLIEYVGSAASASGATGAVADAIVALGENLDTVAEALAVIATVMGVRYVTGAVAAAGASVLASNAFFAMQARAAGAATSVEALNFAMAGLGKANLVTAAILALGAGIYYLKTQTMDAREATGAYAKAQDEANAITDKASNAALTLASAHGKAREQALALARAEAENIKKKLESARASVVLAQAELARARVAAENVDLAGGGALASGAGAPGADFGAVFGSTVVTQADLRKAEANAKAAKDTVASLQNSLEQVTSAINGSAPSPVSGVTPGGGKKTPGSKGSGASGPDPAEIARRHADEMDRLYLEERQATLDITTNAEDRAAIQSEMLDKERAMREREILADDTLGEKERKARLEYIDKLYGKRGTGQGDDIAVVARTGLLDKQVDRERQRQLEQESQAVADERFRAEQDALRTQYDLADSQAERRAIALKTLDLEYQYQKAMLEAVKNSDTATAADKELARIKLAAVEGARGGQQEQARRSTQGPLESYLQDLNKSGDALNEQVEGFVVDELQSFRDSMADGVSKLIGTKDPLLNGLIKLFIDQVIMRPIAEALASAGGGGGGVGGFIGSVVGSIFGGGRAIGGPVRAGTPYKVGENGEEMFVPQQSGVIIPNHRMKGNSGGVTVIQPVNIDARGGVMTPELIEYINSTSRNEANRAAGSMGKAVIQNVPARMTQYNRDGT